MAGLLSGGYFLFLRGDKAPTLTYGGAKIKDAGGVLKRAESNVATIVTTRHGAKSPDARCYFAVPENPADGAKKTDVDTNLRCGPVLFVDGDTTKTFLSFPLSKSGSGGTVSLTAATTPRNAEPDVAPADMKLKRPDGKSAPSGEKLVVPKPPPAEKAALLDVDLGSATPPKRLDNAKMISLNTGVRLVAVGIVERYGHGDAARSAAPGEQLIAFRVADAPGEKASQTTTDLLKVLVPGSPVRPVPHADASDSYVVVAVPTGSTAQLQLTAGGYTQTLSLPSGEPGPKNLKVLLRSHRTLTLTQKAVIPVSISNGSSTAPLSFSATAHFAALDFWPPGHEGAHPNSTANALLSVRLTYTDSSAPGKTFGFDSELLRLKLPDGRTVAARNIAPSGRVFNVFEVPASFTGGTVLVTGSENSGGITLSVVKPASFPIAFAAD